MATQVQFRRGTTSQNNAFTGAQGELTIDTDVWTIRIHDGATAGGKVVPTLTATQTFTNKTMGSSSVWNGNAVGLGYGGTGAALSGVAGAVVYSTGSAMAMSLAGTSGQVLTSGGTSGPTWVNASSLSTGTATSATTASNILGGSAGYLMYQTDTDTTGFIAPGASGYILRSTGASTAPSWVTSALTIGTTALQVGDTAASFDGLNILTASGTSHWKIPVGTVAQRPASPAVGMIRYNSDQSAYEGYASGAWSSLGGVKSVDGYTYIIAETSPTASNGDLDFYAEAAGGTSATQVGQWNRTNLKDYTGTIVGTQTTQNVFNATATTVNAFGAATALNIGNATTATVTLRPGTVVGSNTTQNLWNTTATTVNAFGAATTVSIGAATGTTTINNANTAITGSLAINTNKFTVAASTGNTAIAGTLGVTGIVSANDTTQSSSTITGGLITAGGLGVAKNAYIGGDLTISGNFTVNGTTTTISSTSLELTDPLIYMATGNSGNSADIGIVGHFTSGTYQHTGLVRDATDSKWKLFSGVSTEPSTTIDFTTWTKDTLQVGAMDVTSAVFNGSTSGTITVQATATAGSNTLTLPAATDTLVGKATTDTLTNKSISLTTNTVTFTSLELKTACSDETGSGSLVFATSPTLVTPTLGVASATSINKVTITAPATGSTLTIADGKTLTVSNTLTFTGTDSSSVAFGAGGTVLYSGGALGTPSSATLTNATGLPLTTGVTGTLPVANGGTGVTTSTGSGNNVLSASPTLTGTLSGAAASFSSTVATGALTVTGAITATSSITSYYSDDRLKTRTGNIQNALEKVLSLDGFHYHANETAVALGYDASKEEVGLSAQQVQAVLPEVIAPAPIDPQYMTLHYERLVPLLVEAIKEQQKQIEELKAKLGN